MILYTLNSFYLSPQINQVTSLVLCNLDLGQHFDSNRAAFSLFLDCLKNADALNNLNLRNCSLSHTQLHAIAEALEQRSDKQLLECINIIGNSPEHTVINTRMQRLCHVLIAKYSTTKPYDFKFEDDFKLMEEFCEHEIKEMLVVAQQMRLRHPHIVKFHSYYNSIDLKDNSSLSAQTDIQTHLGMPVVCLCNGALAIIPKFKQIPEKFTNASERRVPGLLELSKTRRLKLGFLLIDDKLVLTFVQIYTVNNPELFIEENDTFFRANRPMLFQVRKFQYLQMPEYVGSKLYRLSAYHGAFDLEDYTKVLVEHYSKNKEYSLHIKIAIAMLLELICFHNNGLLHGDVKLQNIMIRVLEGTPITTLIDLEHTKPLPPEECDFVANIGTQGFRAPELYDGNYSGYVAALDNYSLGVSMAYVFLCSFTECIEEAVEIVNTHTHEFPEIQSILLLIQGLLKQSAQERSTIQQVFLCMHACHPGFFNMPIQHYYTEQRNLLSMKSQHHPTSKSLIDAALPQLALPAEPAANLDSLTHSMNIIFKIQIISYYLNLFAYTNLIDAEAVFRPVLNEILAMPDHPIEECTDRYYYDHVVEDLLTRLHNGTYQANP